MKKLIAIGEALIDFLPNEVNCEIKDVPSFTPKVGGAPLNVLGAYSKLGGNTEMITMLGADPFGDKIVAEMDKYKIHDHMKNADRMQRQASNPKMPNMGQMKMPKL